MQWVGATFINLYTTNEVGRVVVRYCCSEAYASIEFYTMKVLDVKDVKLVPQPEESECDEEGGEMVFPENNVKRVMLMPSVLLVQVFNIVMSFATIFIWLLYTQWRLPHYA